MKPIIEKVLASGLVDKATVELMEQWKYLPEGASSKVKEDALKGATQETLTELARNLADEVEKEHHLRETYLDLERIRWPASIGAIIDSSGGERRFVAGGFDGVKDRMGRYYFRIQDVKEDWFVPGFMLEHNETSKEDGRTVEIIQEKIIQSQVLYIGEQGVCVQITTDRSN